jgi:hypothetical protein
MRSMIIAFLLVFFPLLSAGAQPSSLDSLYNVAKTKYDDGDVDGAELAALRGLREASALDDLARLRFHLMLGYVYVAREQPEIALKEFTAVLEANPAYDLDPVQTSPKILDVFRETRRDYLQRVASEPAVFRLRQADARLAASWRSAILPGWGQMYKQQEMKGAALMAAQAISLAALIFMEVEVHNRHHDYLSVKEYRPADDPTIETRYTDYRRAYRIRNAFGYVTLGIYTLNYLDALYWPVKHKK